MSLAFDELACVDWAVYVGSLPFSVMLVISPVAFVWGAFGVLKVTESANAVGCELPFIKGSISVCVAALAMLLVVEPLTDVDITVYVSHVESV